jgi:hypothetical protein
MWSLLEFVGICWYGYQHMMYPPNFDKVYKLEQLAQNILFNILIVVACNSIFGLWLAEPFIFYYGNKQLYASQLEQDTANMGKWKSQKATPPGGRFIELEPENKDSEKRD